jgi:hypothetical protein
MSKHVMLDLECLGNTPPGVILSIGACEFDAAGVGKEFYYRIDVASSLLHGLTTERSTIEWWRQQSNEAQAAAFYHPGAVTLEIALDRWGGFVNKSTYLWAKGPDYDCVMLKAAYEAFGRKLPWSFRNCRDVRTILALSGVHQDKGPLAHNALEDAKSQAIAVIDAHLALGRKFEE